MLRWRHNRSNKHSSITAMIHDVCSQVWNISFGNSNTDGSELKIQLPSIPMSVSPCFASCRCCADSREYQERVQYHARRFASSKCYQEVLQRYDLRRQRADTLELQRFTFPVASWVAELDSERMTQKCLAGSGWWFQRWACLKKRYPLVKLT